jgi:hypothetical protein
VTPGEAGGDWGWDCNCGCVFWCDCGGMAIGGVTDGVAPAGPHGDAQPTIATEMAARASSVVFRERAKAGFSAGLKGEWI